MYHGKSADEEHQEAGSSGPVSHTAGACHSLPLLKSHNVSQDMSQLTMSQIPHPPLQSVHCCCTQNMIQFVKRPTKLCKYCVQTTSSIARMIKHACDVADQASIYRFTQQIRICQVHHASVGCTVEYCSAVLFLMTCACYVVTRLIHTAMHVCRVLDKVKARPKTPKILYRRRCTWLIAGTSVH